MQTTQVFKVPVGQLLQMKGALLESFPEFVSVPPSQNVQWRLKAHQGGVSAYSSGKIVVQLDSNLVRKVGDVLGGDAGLINESFVPHIGVDESGKGDYFGSLVVAGVFVGSDDYEKLKGLGIQDSKKLSDSRILEIAVRISEICDYRKVLVIEPLEYSSLYDRFCNVNKLLAWGHASVIEDILEDIPAGVCNQVMIDQFSKSKDRVLDALRDKGKKVELIQKHKGESDFAVAAASILARAEFVKTLANMGEKYGVVFPKGASNVLSFAREFVGKEGFDELKKVAKVSFRTTSQI